MPQPAAAASVAIDDAHQAEAHSLAEEVPSVRVYFGSNACSGTWLRRGLARPGMLACLAKAISDVTRGCPICPDVLASEFLLALAGSAPLEVAADLYGLAAEWS